MNARNPSGLTWTEVIVGLAVVGVLAILALPNIASGPRYRHGQMTQSLSNMKQLHLATTQMTLDGETTKNTNWGWPGSTGGTFSHWANSLVEGGYLAERDLCKLLSGPGRIVPTNSIPTSNTGAVLVYAVTTHSLGDASPSDTVFPTPP